MHCCFLIFFIQFIDESKNQLSPAAKQIVAHCLFYFFTLDRILSLLIFSLLLHNDSYFSTDGGHMQKLTV